MSQRIARKVNHGRGSSFAFLALGAETNTTFSVECNEKICSSMIFTDLKDMGTFNRYRSQLDNEFRGRKIEGIAYDLHPDYVSSGIASELARRYPAVKKVPVQHHLAHIASVLSENHIDCPVIGFAFDGTGYGYDGHSWGGEVMIVSQTMNKRLYHLNYVAQPGSDAAIYEPWRMAVSYLYAAYGSSFNSRYPAFSRRIGETKVKAVSDILEKRINSPLTSSAGRLFDGVASLLGLTDYSVNSSDAPISIEKHAIKDVNVAYPYDLQNDRIVLFPMIDAIVSDIKKKKDTGVICSTFMNTLISIVHKTSLAIRKDTGISKVAVSGGCFLNGYLLNGVKRKLKDSGFEVYCNINIPCSDVNISVGQLHILKNTRLN